MNHEAETANKSASYNNRVRRGDQIRFVAPSAVGTWIYDDGQLIWEIDEATRLVPGQTYQGTVRSESNAGFRGIEMAVEIDGRSYSGISTGAIVRSQTTTAATTDKETK